MNITVKPESSRSPHALAGKVALVTGSTSGIGLGIARALAAADMTRPESIAEMIAAIVAQSGRLDILVNNAGIQHVARLDRFPVEKWDQILAINLSSAFHTTRLALPVDGGWTAH